MCQLLTNILIFIENIYNNRKSLMVLLNLNNYDNKVAYPIINIKDIMLTNIGQNGVLFGYC